MLRVACIYSWYVQLTCGGCICYMGVMCYTGVYDAVTSLCVSWCLFCLLVYTADIWRVYMLCGRLCITWVCMMQNKKHQDTHKEVITLVKTTKNKAMAETDDLRSKVCVSESVSVSVCGCVCGCICVCVFVCGCVCVCVCVAWCVGGEGASFSSCRAPLQVDRATWNFFFSSGEGCWPLSVEILSTLQTRCVPLCVCACAHV